MGLSKYHLGYVNLPEDKAAFGLRAKEIELQQVFEKMNYKPSSEIVTIAVLGCADKRFVAGHKEIFEKLFNRKVDAITFDITVEHLQGEENVIEHDCTKPLPNGPFDLIFAHILLKFMPPEKQWLVLQNSYNALKQGGVALFFMDVGGKSQITSMLVEGFYQIPLEEIKKKLSKARIKFRNMIIKSPIEHTRDLECLVLLK